ncbi:MAG: flagellar export chaperone FlgN [Actinomycetota bacterium]
MDALDELTKRLVLLHDQMEQLLCALDIQQLVLANNRLRWLPAVTESVEMLVHEIHLSESERLPVAYEVAASLGVAPEATLAEMADAAGEPYRSTWRRTRLGLLALHREVDQVTAANRELSRHGVLAANEVITTIGGTGEPEPAAYSASGQSAPIRQTTHRFDRTA